MQNGSDQGIVSFFLCKFVLSVNVSELLIYFILFVLYIVRLVAEKTEEYKKEKRNFVGFLKMESTFCYEKSETEILFYLIFYHFPVFSHQPIVNCSKLLFYHIL